LTSTPADVSYRSFTDYFALLKVDGAWKIANKVYSSRPTK
jgi:hypothetical protein